MIETWENVIVSYNTDKGLISKKYSWIGKKLNNSIQKWKDINMQFTKEKK